MITKDKPDPTDKFTWSSGDLKIWSPPDGELLFPTQEELDRVMEENKPDQGQKRRVNVTPEKKIYDVWVAEHFQSRGWKPFIITKTGRYADVLAIRGNELAIIEVKSPNERSSSPSYETREQGDSRKLSAALDARHRAYLREARKKASDLLPRPAHSTFVRLYAMVIAAQLYRYYFEFEDKASKYEPFTGAFKLRGVQFSKSPFLVVPREYADELRTATEMLATHGFIVSPSFETTPKLAISSFLYPLKGNITTQLGDTRPNTLADDLDQLLIAGASEREVAEASIALAEARGFKPVTTAQVGKHIKYRIDCDWQRRSLCGGRVQLIPPPWHRHAK